VCGSDKPSAPENLRVTAVSRDSVSLAWDEPAHDGGAPVRRYVVEKADVKRGVFSEAGAVDAADNRQVQVGKLLEGNDYMFRVAAENDIGLGKPAALAEPVTAKLPFGTIPAFLIFLFIMKFVRLGTQIKTRCEKKKTCKNTQKVHYEVHKNHMLTKSLVTHHRRQIRVASEGRRIVAPACPRPRPTAARLQRSNH